MWNLKLKYLGSLRNKLCLCDYIQIFFQVIRHLEDQLQVVSPPEVPPPVGLPRVASLQVGQHLLEPKLWRWPHPPQVTWCLWPRSSYRRIPGRGRLTRGTAPSPTTSWTRCSRRDTRSVFRWHFSLAIMYWCRVKGLLMDWLRKPLVHVQEFEWYK